MGRGAFVPAAFGVGKGWCLGNIPLLRLQRIFSPLG